MIRDSFIMYRSFCKPIKGLSNEEKGILYDSICNYALDGIAPQNLSPLLQLAFNFIKETIDRDAIKYLNVVERNRENGKKGGRKNKEPKEPSGLSGNPNKSKEADNDNDTDNGNDNENEEGNDSDDPEPIIMDKDLSEIYQIYHTHFLKKEIFNPQISNAWKKAIKRFQPEQIKEILRKAYESSYLYEKADLSFMLSNLEGIKDGKYENRPIKRPLVKSDIVMLIAQENMQSIRKRMAESEKKPPNKPDRPDLSLSGVF